MRTNDRRLISIPFPSLYRSKSLPLPKRPRWRRAAENLIAAYGVVLFLLWLLHLVIGEPVPGIGMLVSILHRCMIPAVVLAPLCFGLRKWRLGLALAPSAVIFLATYGIFFLPRAQPLSAEQEGLQVVTFNIQIPRGAEVDSVVSVVSEIDADIIAFQELSRAAAERFAVEFTDIYPYQALHPQDYEPAGQGILSRYPILADSYWRYDQDEWSFGHQRVELDFAGTCVVFINTHPIPLYTPARGMQGRSHEQTIANILERGLVETAPNVLLGDFNMSDHAQAYRRITSHYTDAYRAVGDIGFGFTFPYGPWPWVPPLVRLDYIFYSPAWQGASAMVWPHSGTSDHAPLLARLLPAFDQAPTADLAQTDEESAEALSAACGSLQPP